MSPCPCPCPTEPVPSCSCLRPNDQSRPAPVRSLCPSPTSQSLCPSPTSRSLPVPTGQFSEWPVGRSPRVSADRPSPFTRNTEAASWSVPSRPGRTAVAAAAAPPDAQRPVSALPTPWSNWPATGGPCSGCDKARSRGAHGTRVHRHTGPGLHRAD